MPGVKIERTLGMGICEQYFMEQRKLNNKIRFMSNKYTKGQDVFVQINKEIHNGKIVKISKDDWGDSILLIETQDGKRDTYCTTSSMVMADVAELANKIVQDVRKEFIHHQRTLDSSPKLRKILGGKFSELLKGKKEQPYLHF